MAYFALGSIQLWIMLPPIVTSIYYDIIITSVNECIGWRRILTYFQVYSLFFFSYIYQWTFFYKEICAKYVQEQARMMRFNKTVSWKVIHLLSNRTQWTTKTLFSICGRVAQWLNYLNTGEWVQTQVVAMQH